MKKRIIAGMLALCLAMSLPAGALATTTPSATPAATVQETEPDAAAPESTAPASSDADAASSDASDAVSSDANAASDAATDAAPSDAASSDAPADPSFDAASSAASDATTGVEGDTSAASSAATDAAPSDAAASDAASSDAATAPDAAAEITYTEDAADGITVTAAAAAGVLPDGVTMLATRITGEDETAAVAAQLDEQGVTYDGFLPLDISFINGDGDEVEPSGPVSVTIELNDTAALGDADLSTLAVQHLTEDETGNVTGVETVAAVNPADGEGTITVPDAAQPMTLSLDEESATEPAATGIVAEFAVDSFSTFTITWGYSSSNNQVTIHYVDQYGNSLEATQRNVTVGSGSWVQLSQYSNSINSQDFTYLGAHLNSYNGTSASWIRYRNSSYYYSADSSQPTGNGTRWSNQSKDVYLVYKYASTETSDSVRVYLYTQVEGDTTGLTINSEGWYTVGYVDLASNLLPQAGDLEFVYGYNHKDSYEPDVLNAVKQALKDGSYTAFETNKSVLQLVLDQIDWKSPYGLTLADGASDYIQNGQGYYTWHLDGKLNIKYKYFVEYYVETTESGNDTIQYNGKNYKMYGTDASVVPYTNDNVGEDRGGTYHAINIAGYEYEGTRWHQFQSSTNENGAFKLNTSTTKNATIQLFYDAMPTLTVTKTVTGNMGDKTREFDFTLTLTKNGAADYTEDVSYTKGTDTGKQLTYDTSKKNYPFTLAHGETIQITVPSGYTATVTEATPNDYKSYVTVDKGNEGTDTVTTGSVNTSASHTIDFRNDKTMAAPTGLTRSAAPYLAMVALAVAGCGVAVRRRRRGE